MIVDIGGGRIVDFGDMSQEQVEAAIRGMQNQPGAMEGSRAPGRWQNQPPQNVAIAPPAERWAHGLGEAAVEGGVLALGGPGDVAELGRQYIENPLRAQLGYEPATGVPLPTSSQLLTGANQLGLAGDPRYAPQNIYERGARAAVRGGVAGGLGAAAMPGVGLIPGVAGGAAGSLSSQAAAELGAPRELQLAAGLVGGTIGQSATGALLRQKPLDAEAIAGKLGTSADYEAAGSALKEGAAQWYKNMPAELSKAWAPFDASMAPATMVRLDHLDQAVQGVAQGSGTMQPFGRTFTGALPAALKSRFSQTPAGMGMPVPWEDVQKLRSQIGNAMRDQRLMPDMTQNQIRSLYGALSNDMRAAASSLGPDVLEKFDNANARSWYLYNFAGKHINKIVPAPENVLSQRNPNDGTVGRWLINTGRLDGQTIRELRDELPTEVNEAAAAHLRANPTQPLKNLSPGAREALYEDPAHRAALEAISPATAPGTSAMERVARHTAATLAGNVFGGLTAAGSAAAGITGAELLAREAVAHAVGSGVPLAWRYGKRAVQNPLLAVPPTMGAEAGGYRP